MAVTVTLTTWGYIESAVAIPTLTSTINAPVAIINIYPQPNIALKLTTKATLTVDVPVAGIIPIVGQVPTASITTTPPRVNVPVAGIVPVTGQVPAINITALTNIILAPVAIVPITGQAPTITLGDLVIRPSVANIPVTGQIPTIKVSLLVPVAGIIPITGQVPTISLTTSVAALAYNCHVLSHDTKRTFDFANYNFIGGFGRFNQVFLGAKADGIYDLETVATDDAGTEIDASMEIKTDFDIPEYQRITNMAVIMEGAKYKLTVTDANGNEVDFVLQPDEFRQLTGTYKSNVDTLKFENINGEQITFKEINGKAVFFKY